MRILFSVICVAYAAMALAQEIHYLALGQAFVCGAAFLATLTYPGAGGGWK